MNTFDLFQPEQKDKITTRLQQLAPQSTPAWGSMNAAQMLAHLNAMFDLALDPAVKRPPAFVCFMLKLLVKKKVTGPKPYKQNEGTAPQFKIKHQPDFEREAQKLSGYIAQLEASGFRNKKHPVFGPLTQNEWSTLFHKHIDHHLQQFKV